MEKEVNFRIQCGWNNWKKMSRVICERRVPVKVKSKVYKAVIRPTLIYGLGAAPLKKVEERKFNVTDEDARMDVGKHVGREVIEMEVEDVLRRGRPRPRLKNRINADMRGKDIAEESVSNRNMQRRLIQNGEPE
ncbi:uncharacterized protein LOC122242994 [Penaeus japonicus]|uniref:uncharacterized protein LOC122242994 n=1 Tax=Penaeus japonicus TaxID=27405 RepID=UPI001C70E820|nr:uncharacterized protein LOC122242994 [Penaeus japonicus]